MMNDAIVLNLVAGYFAGDYERASLLADYLADMGHVEAEARVRREAQGWKELNLRKQAWQNETDFIVRMQRRTECLKLEAKLQQTAAEQKKQAHKERVEGLVSLFKPLEEIEVPTYDHWSKLQVENGLDFVRLFDGFTALMLVHVPVEQPLRTKYGPDGLLWTSLMEVTEQEALQRAQVAVARRLGLEP